MEKAVYVLPSNVIFDSSSITYDGKEHSIIADNIPDGIIPIYHNNTGTDAGHYDASVTYVLSSLLTSKYSSVEPSGMTASLTIHQAAPTYTVPTGLNAVEGQTLADVSAQLSAGFSFEDPLTSSVGLPGDNTFLLTFNPGSGNYKTVTGIKATIHVAKKEIPAKPKFLIPANITFSDRTETYTGSEYAITAENIPEELSVVYSGNTRTDAGSQTATATFQLSNKGLESYSGIEGTTVMTANLTILQAEPTYTVPTGLNAVEGQTLADVSAQLGEGFSFEEPLTSSVGLPGDNIFLLTFNPGSSNYKTVTGIKATIHVVKKETPAKPKFLIPANITFTDRTETYSGTAYTITAENVPEELSVAYTNNTRTGAGSQTATATFQLSDKGLENYSGIDGATVMTATLTILQAEPTYTVPTGLNAVEGQTLADVSAQLGEGFSFEDDPSTLVGSAGDNEFMVTYTPGSSNYKTVTGIKATIHVAKKETPTKPKFQMPSNITFHDRTETYSGTAYTITAENVPEELSVSYTNNMRTGAGSQTAKATFRLSDKGLERYSGIEGTTVMTANLTILQAEPTYTVPTGLTAVEGQTLADVSAQLGKGFSFEDEPSTLVGSAGDNVFKVTYTPGSSNYKTVSGIIVSIHVKQVYVLPSNVSFPDMEEVYEPDKVWETKVLNLPDDIVTAVYTNNTRSTAGIQRAQVEFHIQPAYADTYGAVSPSSMEAIINVHKAVPKYTPPTGLTAIVGQTLADVATQLGKGFAFEDAPNTSVGGEGINNFTVSYTPDDTDNYQIVSGILVPIQVRYDYGPVDKTRLNELIAKAEEAIVNKDSYAEINYSAFLSAYQTAKGISEDTQQTVDEKVASIESALALLEREVPNPGDIIDRSDLDQAIDTVKALKEKHWTPGSYKATLAGYETALLMSEDTQEEIDKKTQAINAALGLLIVRPSLTAKPNQTLGDIAGQLADYRKTFTFEEDLSTSVGGLGTNTFHVRYTPEDGGEIETYIEVEVYVSETGERPSPPAPDYTELEALIGEILDIDPSDYTEDSYDVYLEALSAAMDMPEKTQEEVDQKVAAIEAVLALLVPKET